MPGTPSLRPDPLVGASILGDGFGHVCPARLTEDVGVVACRELGLAFDELVRMPRDHDWSDVLAVGTSRDLDCDGTESSLLECARATVSVCVYEVASFDSYLIRCADG